MKKNVNFSNFLKNVTIGSVIGFTNYVYNLFSYTIPSFFGAYFKEIGSALIMLAVFAFAIVWLMKATPYGKPPLYLIKVYDIFGIEIKIDGIRTEYKLHDVAWSFMKQYKAYYPLYNFAMVSDLPNSEKMTIFRYL